MNHHVRARRIASVLLGVWLGVFFGLILTFTRAQDAPTTAFVTLVFFPALVVMLAFAIAITPDELP